MTDSLSARMAREAVEFASISTSVARLANDVADARGALRKAGSREDTMDSLAQIEAEARGLADRLDRLAAQPLPLHLA